MSRAACPSEQRLSAFVRGELFDPQVTEVAEHVATCVACCRVLAALPTEDPFAVSLRQAASVEEAFPESLMALRRRLAAMSDRVATLSASAETTQYPHRPRADESNNFQRLLTPPRNPDELGSLGSYRVLRLLGEGGMGVVLLAEEISLGRQVALKIMQPKYATDREVAARFEREARSTAAVRSEYVVSIFAVGKAETPLGLVPYMAMEHLQGESLERRLQQGRPEFREVIELAQQVATGLAAVHAKGLVHRDIKPGNIWLERLKRTSSISVAGPETDAVRAKLLDFGLAHAGATTTTLTQLGTLIGTPAYMSPEQASGHDVDARSDLFSLGAVLYEMTTGQQPFRGSNTMAVLMSLARDIPPAPKALVPQISERLSNLIMKLLEKDRERRPATATEVIHELLAIQNAPKTPPASHEKATFLQRLWLNSNRWQRITTSVGLLALTIVVGGWLFSLLIRVETEKGTLVIETEDEDVEVRITKNGATLLDRTKNRQIKLAVGEYGVELVNKVNGLKLSAEKITITRDGQPPIRISREPPQSVSSTVEGAVDKSKGQPVGVVSKPKTAELEQTSPVMDEVASLPEFSPSIFERPLVQIGEGQGKWRVQNGELFCAEPSKGETEDWLFFGLLDWTDYDFCVQARSEPATEGHGPGVFFRSQTNRRATLAAMNVFRGERDYFEEIDGEEWRAPWNNSQMPVHVGHEFRDWTKQWRTIKISVRGKSAKVFVEDEPILAYDKLALASGYVGVRSHNAWPSRYRNPRVTLPDGRVLLDGWPAIPSAIGSVDTAAARRFVNWIVSRSGRFVPAKGGPIKTGDDLPADTMLHLLGFEADPAIVRPIKDSDIEAFRDFPGVENYVSFRFADLTTAGVIRLGALIRGKPISCFGLVDSQVGLAWLREPGGLGEITNAIFQNINAKDEELQHLKNLRYLGQLNLRFNKGITDVSIDHILKLEHLKHIHVDETGITAAGLARLRAAYPNAEITPNAR